MTMMNFQQSSRCRCSFTIGCYGLLTLMLSTILGQPARGSSITDRVLRAGDICILAGQTGSLQLQLNAQGDENALGFSLCFDPALLTYVDASLGTDAQSQRASLIKSEGQKGSGRVGYLIGLPAGQSFTAGTQEVLQVIFQVVTAGGTVQTEVSFCDQPVVREVSDPDANVLECEYEGASVTVGGVPTISQQPSDATVCPGQQACFTVAASGDVLGYQWQTAADCAGSWTDVSGATGSQYCLTAAAGDDNKKYRCRVSNACGTADSNCVTLTVKAAPTITQQPTDQSVCPGSQACFSVTASGTAPLSYQWQTAADCAGTWTDISGATNPQYCLTTAVDDNGKKYRCRVSNACGTADSNCVTLTVKAAPTITQQPTDQSVCPGSLACFSVTASGTASLSYQWQTAADCAGTWTDIANATGSEYCLAAGAGDNGKKYRCRVSNACGTVDSNCVTLTVKNAPAITQQPTDQSVCPGQQACFSVTASGTASLSYQWQASADCAGSWTDISGATGSQYCLTAAAGDNGRKYRCRVSNACGTVDSNCVALTVNSTDCDDGDACTTDVCVDGECVHEAVDCGDEVCDPATGECVACLVNADCDDGLFCSGVETCAAGVCVAGTAPCVGDKLCDEDNSRCVDCLVAADCNDGEVCDPATGECIAEVVCTYSISKPSQSFTSPGGAGSFSVNTTSSCAWSASKNVSWIMITSGSNGNGNGTVNYRVAPNSSTTLRTGTIIVAGHTHTVNQSGATPLPVPDCVADADCDDGDACTTDACVDGECVFTPVVCDDENPCTTDECVDDECVFTPVVCDDGDACTTDACVDGECMFTAIVCDDEDVCTEDACVDGECVFTAVVCDDGDLCTTDACVDGECVHEAVDCGEEVCDPATGECVPVDLCPDDPDKSEPGVCGCGVPDVDSDGDGVLDCNDACPADPDKWENEGICGCGVPESPGCGEPVMFVLRILSPSGESAPVAYESGTSVQVNAPEAPAGQHFSHWSGDASGSDNPVTVVMDADKVITANYAEDAEPPPPSLPCFAAGPATLALTMFGLIVLRLGNRRRRS